MLDWYAAHESCTRYFLDHAQHESSTRALCALINIKLPFQWSAHPVHGFAPSSRDPSTNPHAVVSLVPYIRRLIVTAFDKPAILHGFFGDAWTTGIGPLHECERRNYAFATKNGGWSATKCQYDMNEHETVPFMMPLGHVKTEELETADRSWSEWLSFEDWEIGPRARAASAADRDNHQRSADWGLPDGV